MNRPSIIAAIQLNCQDNLAANLAMVEKYVRQAARRKAIFITMPENSFFMQAPGKGGHPSTQAGVTLCEELAKELNVWILIGSVQLPSGEGKSWNRSILITPEGNHAASYDKIHLFDVTLKNGEDYKESARIDGGSEAVIAHTSFATLGMTICYDLRFPHLYRTLAQAGADILLVPSAFTQTTGKAHWHALLRARAIENGCYVVAPAQCGVHPGKRKTYGHSLIIAPWGEILAEASEDQTGIITASFDKAKIKEARTMVPSLKHDRAFGLKSF